MTPLAPTPYLAVDLERLQGNIDRMAALARDAGVALRPHVKTHKCVEIARMQVEAGAQGITVATIGEGEVFAETGFDDVFIAYPLWLDEAKAERLVRLSQRIGGRSILLGVDAEAGVANVARAQGLGAKVQVLVEIDSGHHRSGVSPAKVADIAYEAEDAGVGFAGVFTFPGHSYAPGEGRFGAAVDEAQALAVAKAALEAEEIDTESLLFSGGSSPSAAFTATVGEASPLNELRPGVYVFGDAQQWELGACAADDIALTAHATVVSHAGGRAVLDSGSKILGADRAPWATGYGRLLDHPDARIVILSEHHAVVDMAGAELPPLGSVVRVVPNHACNAVNLVDTLTVTSTNGDIQTWAVAARGANA
ncbi:MAG: alanine racemase [Dermatophilus congolensis]|nr:alanine racemase [Dermatophilus congolensis]